MAAQNRLTHDEFADLVRLILPFEVRVVHGVSYNPILSVHRTGRPIPWLRSININRPVGEVVADLWELRDTYELEMADIDRQVDTIRRTSGRV